VVFLEVVEEAVHLVEVEADGGGKKVLTAFPLYQRGTFRTLLDDKICLKLLN